jgi:circadian clock protein KaiC
MTASPINSDSASQQNGLQKAPTGMYGLDEITAGGLPRGRTTLVCGGPGCGKTLFGTQFLVSGAREYGEPGVLMTFEETSEEVTQNVASLGYEIDELVAAGKLYLDHVRIERHEITETGDYDLEGLFVRLAYAIEQVGARRVVLDTIETLFAGLSNQLILRAELRRLFRWLNDRGITAVITGEQGEGRLTRHGLEEYVSDCVILLDHRVNNQISTRRLRVVKYRGSQHGTNEYPFLIDETGLSVLPITSMGLQHEVAMEQVPTGVPDLDAMFSGGGVYRGSSVLISGAAGTGKTSLGAHFADAACARGERVLYAAYEESPQQIGRNMASIGLDLRQWVERDLLHIHSTRPHLHGLEMHLLKIHKLVDELQPSVVVIDPVTNLMAVGSNDEVEAALTRLIDFLKSRQVTMVLTSLTSSGVEQEATSVGISSLMDSWILLKAVESDGERNRVLYLLKSRGMAHSHQVREMLITTDGVRLREVYLGTEGVLTGAARSAQESRDRAAALRRTQETERRQREIERKRRILEARVSALHAEFEAEETEVTELIEQDRAREAIFEENRSRMSELRDDPQRNVTATNNGEEAFNHRIHRHQ